MPVELLFLLLLRVDGQGRRTPRQVTNVPMTPVVAPQPIRSSILPHSMEITWPRGDDAVVEPPASPRPPNSNPSVCLHHCVCPLYRVTYSDHVLKIKYLNMSPQKIYYFTVI